jgi:Glycosyltransferase family 87
MKKTLQLLERHLGAFFLLYSLLLFGLAICSPIVGDYCPYLQQWHNVYHGLDPWAMNGNLKQVVHIPWFNFCGKYFFLARNAYGPLFNVYGLTSIIYPTIPRAIGAFLFSIISWKIVKEIRAREDLDWRVRFWLYFGMFGNFFSFVFVGISGGNDVYLAFLICAAIIALYRGDPALAGVAIGLGALIKFYPLYLVAFMALDRRRLNIKFVTVAIATFIVGAILAYAEWGTSIFEPLLLNLDREATRSSIMFILLSCFQSLFHISIPVSWVVIGLVPLAIAALILQYKLRLSNLTGFLIGYILILTFNQIGYVVYYFPLMLAIYLYYLFDRPSHQLSRALLILFVTILFQAIFSAFGTTGAIYRIEFLYNWARIPLSVVITMINLYVIAELIRQKQDSTEQYIGGVSG